MKSTLFAVFFLGAVALATPQAVADQDLLPLITWTPSDPPSFEFFFDNDIPPHPDQKVLQFVGEARSLVNAFPATFDIQIYFDYVAADGTTVLVPPPPFGYSNVLPADTNIYHIEGGPVILPFCPPRVSIHFEIVSEVPIEFQGLFDHTCIPVPEPSAAALLLLGCVPFVTRRRPR
ncbi:MAG: PEP-CTERM sorting domain-containing protein [Pirellulales bacterium]